MIKWTLIVVAGLAVVIGAVAVIGMMMPKGHRASRAKTFAVSPAAVFATITDFARAAEWRTDLTRVEMLPPADGHIMFREVGRNGPITFRVESLESPTKLVTRIADPSLAFGGTWTFDLRPEGSGTSLTITEDGEVYNPIFRFLSKTVFSPTATIESYLSALERRLSK